jgi:tRNA pseudouridine55 synthase
MKHATVSTPEGLPSSMVAVSPDGVVALDKPAGMSSQAAVTRVKRLFGASKAGHTGTLDPLATGLLPVCLGEATKFSHLLTESEKTYEATIRLGVVTTTGDREGETVATSAVSATRAEVEQALSGLVGDTFQIPPMYSALRHEGRRLYQLARVGTVVPRAARRVHIRCLELRGFTGDMLDIRVVCGKGTYIRVLAEDIGRALNCGGTLHALRRTAVGSFLTVEGGISLHELEALSPGERMRYLMGTDAPVGSLPRVDANPVQVGCLACGRPIRGPDSVATGLVRLYCRASGRFLGIGARGADGVIRPQRLVRASAIQQ